MSDLLFVSDGSSNQTWARLHESRPPDRTSDEQEWSSQDAALQEARTTPRDVVSLWAAPEAEDRSPSVRPLMTALSSRIPLNAPLEPSDPASTDQPAFVGLWAPGPNACSPRR